MSYDEEKLGVNNPSHPANNIEVFDEIELTEEQLTIQNLKDELKDLKEEHEAIKGILRMIDEMEAEQGIYATCMGMNSKQESEYLHLRNSLKIKINRL